MVESVPVEEEVLAQRVDAWSYAPSWSVALMALMLARGGGLLLVPVLDCDETYNFWEPTHFMLYGRGFQTWEYGPEFALRSYAYTGLHAVMGALAGAAWGEYKVRSVGICGGRVAWGICADR